MPTIVQPTKVRRSARVNVLVDDSSSQSYDGKIQAVNSAMDEVGSELLKFASQNPQMELAIQVYRFGGDASRVFSAPVSPEMFRWSPLQASGRTPFGAACDLLADDLEAIPTATPSYAPAIVLVSDGQPNDCWEGPLARMLGCPWGSLSQRIAVAIGYDCDHQMLERFLAGSELGILEPSNAAAIIQAIVDATLCASQAAVCQVDPLRTAVRDRHLTQRSMFDVPDMDVAPRSILDNPAVENARW